ncbi:hypothetical protein HK102_008917, partial [Quaeritorhiza haematococci]
RLTNGDRASCISTIKTPTFPEESCSTFAQAFQNPTEYPSAESLAECVKFEPRSLALPTKCSSGFKFNTVEVLSARNVSASGTGSNVNVTGEGVVNVVDASVTLIADNGRVPFADKQQYLDLINAPGQLIEAVSDVGSIGGGGGSPPDIRANQGTGCDREYDAAQLINIYTNMKQLAGAANGTKPDSQPPFPIDTMYVRFWDRTTDEVATMRAIVPAMIWALQFTLPLMLKTLLHERSTGLRHHLIIHGLPLWIYNLSMIVATGALAGVVLVIGCGFVFSLDRFKNITYAFWILFTMVLFLFNVALAVVPLGEVLKGKKPEAAGSLCSLGAWGLLLPWIILRSVVRQDTLPMPVWYILSAFNPQWTAYESFLNTIRATEHRTPGTPPLPPQYFVIILLFQALVLQLINYLVSGSPFSKAPNAASNSSNSKTASDQTKTAEDVETGMSANGFAAKILNDDSYILKVVDLKYSYQRKSMFSSFSSSSAITKEILRGAGKSTTIKCLIGLNEVKTGQAYLGGDSLIPFDYRVLGKIG